MTLSDSDMSIDAAFLRSRLTFFDHLSREQRRLLETHLTKRFAEPDMRRGLGVVFDITRWCNQGCVLCCTNAKRISPLSTSQLKVDALELNTSQVFKVLHKIKSYVEDRKIANVFINFGGGEPFLRPDFVEIVLEASRLFSPRSVGFDNNGTRITRQNIEGVKDFVEYIGVSIDGLEHYHNEWRKTGKENGFQRAIQFIQSSLELPHMIDKLEVSTVATKYNLDQIPELMRLLHDIGVRKYSIHRTMQVGRAWLNKQADSFLPDARDYLDLIIAVLETNKELGLDVHIHHSIESIYTTLLLGLETYSSKLGDPDRRSSIGIDWYGRVYFDPWCLVEPLSLMFASSAPSLAEDGVTLETILHPDTSSIHSTIQQLCEPHRRCLGCPMPCSGGSRIAAAFYNLSQDASLRRKRFVDLDTVLTRLDQIDPLCPLFAENQTSWLKEKG